jgi:hypothetical protein
MTTNQFRRLALGMTGAIEASHMNHPDFRANGRIFATIAPDHKRGMVKLTPDQQTQFMREHPGMFEPAAGAWGRQGCTMVRLSDADEETVGEAMTLAWRAVTTVEPRGKRAPGGVRRAGKARAATERGGGTSARRSRK